MVTARPRTATTQPPSSGECAYVNLLDDIRGSLRRTDSLALSVALALEGLDPSCSAALAERLYDAVRYS